MEDAFQAGCRAIQQQIDTSTSSDRKLIPVDSPAEHIATNLPYHQISILKKKE